MMEANLVNVDSSVWSKYCELAPAPLSAADTGLPQIYLNELIAKHIYKQGLLDLRQLQTNTALEWNVLEEIIADLKKESLIEIKGPANNTSALRYSLTERGIAFAKNAISKDGYIGFAPIIVSAYEKLVKSQSVHAEIIKEERINEVFSDIVISKEMLDQLGAAINSNRASFIYGPPGAGKSYICNILSQTLSNHVLIPHAIYVDGTVVQLFDPAVHRPVVYENKSGLLKQGLDQRVILCRRPVIVSGGELTIDQLEIQCDSVTQQYRAPLQLKANNGIYLIDDLGRQKVLPKELFNRWIVPMETHRDFLGVANGRRAEVPFDVILLFSTNLNPLQLADDAFLRRIGHKIRFDYIDKDDFIKIWAQVCEANHLEQDSDIIDYVLNNLYAVTEIPMLPCHPRDLIDMALNHHAYAYGERKLSAESLLKAWENYFINIEAVDNEKSAYSYNGNLKEGTSND